MYLVYQTPWSEGEVVAHHTDSKFAIGVNSIDGNVGYVNTLVDLLSLKGFVLCTWFEDEDEDIASSMNTSLYDRVCLPS